MRKTVYPAQRVAEAKLRPEITDIMIGKTIHAITNTRVVD
jgi:hypothetical protein